MLDALLATESSMARRILNMSTAGLMIPFSVQRAQHLVMPARQLRKASFDLFSLYADQSTRRFPQHEPVTW